MIIYVFPRKIVEEWIYSQFKIFVEEWALISIYSFSDGPVITPDTTPLLNKINCNEFISLRFCDIVPEVERLKTEHSDLFNSDHAKTIIEFLDKIKQIPILVVHCAAGISRSGAVGLFANRYFELDESTFRKRNRISPNFHVLDVLNKVSGINDNYVKFWERDFEKNDRMKRIIERIKSI